MLPRSIKMALAEMLENLSKHNFERFCHELLDRREEPRVSRSRVEGKTRLEIADVLVCTFTENGALPVAVELLKEIQCNDEAEALVSQTNGGQ